MFILLGNNGFIGKVVEDYLIETKKAYAAYSRPNFDITDPSTYRLKELNKSEEITIVDCIVRINGSEEEIKNTNNLGFNKWIDFLKNNFPNVKYIYFSTYSTVLPEVYTANFYVNTKREAEQYLIQSLKNYKIIRLAFPFGKGESQNRLISRLINKIKNNETFSIDTFLTNLTPISELKSDLEQLINTKESEINYASSNLISLKEVVDYVYHKLGKTPQYTVSDKQLTIQLEKNFKVNSDKETVFKELDQML